MEQLGYERLGQRLDLLAHLRVLRIEPAENPFSLLKPNLLAQGVHGGEDRPELCSVSPCFEQRHFFFDDCFDQWNLPAPVGEISVQSLLQSIEVVQPYSGEFANFGIHIARQGQINKSQITSPTAFERRFHHLSTNHRVWCCGRSENDVSRAKRLAQLLPGQGTGTNRRHQALRVSGVAPDDAEI